MIAPGETCTLGLWHDCTNLAVTEVTVTALKGTALRLGACRECWADAQPRTTAPMFVRRSSNKRNGEQS